MNTTDPQDEVFPVVNERGEVIGKTTRGEAHRDRTLIHPVIGVFVFNPQGDLLLQKRSATKDLGPNCWTLSVGGHVRFGGDPRETAVREVEEEIGLIIPPARLVLIGETLTATEEESEYWYLYRYDMPGDSPLKAHPDEVAELRFVSLDDLQHMIADPHVEWSEDPKALILKYIL